MSVRNPSLATVEMYDPATDTWTKKADMPTARDVLSTSAVNGKIYAIGGLAGGLAVSTVEEYDPKTNKWTQKTDMPTARDWLSTSTVNGFIYAIGGEARRRTVAFSTVEAYDTGVGIRVTQITPQVGGIAGGDAIAIIGGRFPPDVTVTVDGNPVTELKVTDTLIAGITPPGAAGEQQVLMTAPSIDFTVFAGAFFYAEPTSVVLTGMKPTNGPQKGGNVASITGGGFQPGAAVTVGDVQATHVTVTPTLITFTIPPGTAKTIDVVVTNPDGQKGILSGGYTYDPTPILEAIEPDEGPLSGGTEIIITGKNFIEGVVVEVGAARVQPDSLSPTALRLKTPPGTAGPKTVRVVNPDGQAAPLEGTFTYNPAPTISSVSPNAGPLEGGTRITITGTGFFLGTDVFIGGAKTPFRLGKVVSSTTIITDTPLSSAGPKDVVVRNSDGQEDTLKAGFTYHPAPAIKGITPDNGKLAGGTQIDILGGGFLPGAVVRIGDIESGTYQEAIPSQVVSPGRITAITPKVLGEPGPKDVVVENPDRQLAPLENGFTYNPLPVIQEISPDFGSISGGAKILIRGSGFLSGAQVFIGERRATADFRDASTIEATAPPNPTAGLLAVTVVNPDTQEAVLPGGFRYLPPIPKAKGGRQISLDGHARLYLAPRAVCQSTPPSP